MSRPGGVTASAVVAILGSILTLLVAGVTTVAAIWFLVRHRDAFERADEAGAPPHPSA